MVSLLEDEIEFDEAAIFIEPPPVQEDTDEDSVDEDDSGTISNLNRRQLQAPATVTLRRQDGKHSQSVKPHLQRQQLQTRGDGDMQICPEGKRNAFPGRTQTLT